MNLQRASTHLEGQGCPTCKKSKGEMKIERWLINKGIKYLPQASFPGCKGKKYPLRFDFFLPDLNICIECDGNQHFEPTQYFIADENNAIAKFKEIQLYDRIKNEFCISRGIKLIRIRYDKLKYNHDKVLEKILSGYLI
jgi:hypothetical protein